MWLALPLALGGAICFRIRGGLLEDQHVRGQLSRAAWGFACGVTVWVGAGFAAWPLALGVGTLCWVSTMAGLHNSMDMGRNIDTEAEKTQSYQRRFARDFIVGHWHGIVLGSAAAMPFAWVHWGCPGWRCGPWGALPLWWLPIAAGAAWGLCYGLASLWPDWSGLTRIAVGGVKLGKGGNAPEIGELAFGFEFIAALFFAAST
jgi:hypothetical protein